MKVMNKLFAALILFGMSGAAFGYTFSFNNKTNEPVIVKAIYANRDWSIAEIEPNERKDFSYPRPSCLHKVSVEGQYMIMDSAASFDNGTSCRDLAFDVTKEGNNFKINLLSK